MSYFTAVIGLKTPGCKFKCA